MSFLRGLRRRWLPRFVELLEDTSDKALIEMWEKMGHQLSPKAREAALSEMESRPSLKKMADRREAVGLSRW